MADVDNRRYFQMRKALGAALALVAALLLWQSRYEWHPVGDALAMVRVNTWTGRMELCAPDKDTYRYACGTAAARAR